jgi:selenocysteine lyase/cysteine desulfurase
MLGGDFMATIVNKEMFSDSLLNEIREKFHYVDWDPYTGDRVYLEASGGSLRLKSVTETLAKEVSLPDELYRYNPASDYAVAAMEQGIEDVKLFLGAKSGQIMSANSATQTIFRAVNAVTSHIPGNNVVTTQLDHPAVLSPTKYFADLTGKEWRVVNIASDTGSIPIDTILEKIDKNTCLLCLQQASNQTGTVNDVTTIIRETRQIKPDLYVVVDAVQYAPHGQIDVEDIAADAYAFGPYKAYGVKGIGFAHISDRLADLPHENLLLKADNNWVLGSPAHALFASWTSVVDYLCWLGSHFTDSTDRRELVIASKDAIHLHMMALLDRALNGSEEVEGLLNMDHVTVCGMEEEIVNRMCIFLFRLAGMDSPTASQRYNQSHHVRVSARVRDSYSTYPLEGLGWPDAVRLSAAHYNTPEEIDRFLKATIALNNAK